MASLVTSGSHASPEYPEPMVIEPHLQHRQTLIILHGRGSFASKFGPPLLEAVTSNNETLQAAFPRAKIIFPTASRNRATIYNRSYTHQWFDNWHLGEWSQRQELMIDGLHASSAYIHRLLQKEIAVVGKENVILWGLSQGCATSLTALLTWGGEPFAGVVGMCGWLPFCREIEEIARCSAGNAFTREEDDDNPFGYSDEEDNSSKEADKSEVEGETPASDPSRQAVDFLREELDLEGKQGPVFQEIPVFLGHGTQDERVSLDLGRRARSCLESVGVDVKMVEYEGLGHWYSAEMLTDIFRFVKSRLGEDSTDG